MPSWLPPTLTLLFAAHLAAFGRLALGRGGAYYWLLCALFGVLTGSFAARWLAPEFGPAELPLHLLLRYLAWALAAITIPMLLRRLWRRRDARSA